MRRFLRALGVTVAAGTAAATFIAPGSALAGPDKAVAGRAVAVSQQGSSNLAGWIGTCYVSRGASFAGGWCDGNGPDWTYRGVVTCTNGGTYLGASRWAGDRRGSYGQCPSGTATRGGVRYYYLGVQRGSVLV